jgi:hypothetical protein
MMEVNIESNGLETLRALERYVQGGYLLHGSNSKIEVLEPRQTFDIDKQKTARNQLGIYATESVRIAVSMALMHKIKKADNNWYYHGSEQDFRIGGTGIKLESGYIHVLPRDSFEEIIEGGDRELVSRTLVDPVAVIEINPDILDNMDILLEGDLAKDK